MADQYATGHPMDYASQNNLLHWTTLHSCSTMGCVFHFVLFSIAFATLKFVAQCVVTV